MSPTLICVDSELSQLLQDESGAYSKFERARNLEVTKGGGHLEFWMSRDMEHITGGDLKGTSSLTSCRSRSTSHPNVSEPIYYSSLSRTMSSNFQLPPGLKPAAAPGQGGGPQQPGQDEEARAAQMQAKQQEEEMRRGMLGQILEPSARERCKQSPS